MYGEYISESHITMWVHTIFTRYGVSIGGVKLYVELMQGLIHGAQ